MSDGFDPDDYEDPPSRLPKGYLALDVYNICKQWLAGEIVLEEGEYLTPWRVSRIILQQNDGLEKPRSSGAIDAVYKRWEAIEFATFREVPFAFVDFTPRGKELGLQDFLDAVKEAAKSRRSGISS